MFTGIIEATSHALSVKPGNECAQIRLKRPQNFNDLNIGDSVACNGVCLTVEEFDSASITFTVGFETLLVTGWDLQALQEMNWNLERSLKFGDRIHGHMVSGHVDVMSRLSARELSGDCLLLSFELPEEVASFVWKKSSVTVNGVSLTVNEISDKTFQVCLIPETLRQTNLGDLNVGDKVTIESDYYMKGLLNAKSRGKQDALNG